ncbi:MAG: methyltransferase [Pseudomonadota bacterium]
MTELTENAFLDGRLSIQQPKSGYRAGADPVFLAASVNALPGQRVLDLGCGVGTAMLCLLARVPDASVTGVERQHDLAQIAEGNLSRNGMPGAIVEADVRNLPRSLRDQTFDHVMTNPPFFDRNAGSEAMNAGRELGRGETLDLAVWLDLALRMLAPGGYLTLINRIERLPECLVALSGRAGDIVVLPLAPREERRAKLFLLSARKGAKGPFLLQPPFVVHTGAQHEHDGDSYTDRAQSILRKGQALPLNS